MQYTDSPDYLKGADLHNIGAGNDSFFSDPIGQTTGAMTPESKHIDASEKNKTPD